MPRPIYNQKITRSTDWGGDASTAGAPVSGARVQEYIKAELATLEDMHGELSGAHDTLKGRVETLETGQASQASQITGIQQVISAQGEAIGSLQTARAQLQQDLQDLDDAKADKSAFVVMSESAYDALPAKDNDIFYYIYEE